MSMSMMNTVTYMTYTLKRTDVDDTEKQKLYYVNLERYLNLNKTDKKESETSTIQRALNAEDKKEPNHLENAQLSDAFVQEHLPKT